jgi:hypothetical protein
MRQGDHTRKHRALPFFFYPRTWTEVYACSIKSYCYEDKDVMDLMLTLARAVSSTGTVKHGSFLVSVHQDANVALRKKTNKQTKSGTHGLPQRGKRNYAIFRAGIQLYPRASGHARIPCLFLPSVGIN